MVPGKSYCPVMPIGAVPRLFMAVAQALGSDIGILMELKSMVMLHLPSGDRHPRGIKKKERDFRFPSGNVFQLTAERYTLI